MLAKGNPKAPSEPLPDVQKWHYSGNQLHPTQKSERILEPLIRSFSKQGDIVLDPFCGSASTLIAAKNTKRHFFGIEMSDEYFKIAANRLRKACVRQVAPQSTVKPRQAQPEREK